jgi:hypothetical protein
MSIINPSVSGKTAYDLMRDGSLTSWYEDVDRALVSSEMVRVSTEQRIHQTMLQTLQLVNEQIQL